MKKKVGLSAALVLLLSACGGGGTGSGSATEGDNPNSKEVNLSWSFWTQNDDADAAWEDQANQVSEEVPGVNLELTMMPFADYFTKYQSQLAGNNAPCIVSMQSLRLPAFVDTLEPLSDLIAEHGFDESEWSPGALTALQVDGEQYALPYGLSTMQIFYNKDLFDEADVAYPEDGWTIDEFVEAAQDVTDETGTPAFGQSFSDLHMFSFLHAYNGASPVADDGSLDLVNEKMVDAFTWYSGLSTDLDVASTPASSSDIPWGEQEFLAGNVAMAVDGTWNTASIAADAGFDVGMVTLPVGSDGAHTFSANSGFGISATCDHKDEAAQALLVLASEEAAEVVAEGGTAPARLAGLDVFYDALEDRVGADYSDQARKVSDSSSEFASPFVTTDNWDQVTKAIAQQFILAYLADEDPQTVLENVQGQASN